MRRSPALLCIAALAAAAGCRKDALQQPDAAGSGGIGSIDAAFGDGGLGGDGGFGDGGLGDGGGRSDGGGMDSRWDVTFGSRRSFVVTAQVQIGDAGADSASHSFTMTLDSNQQNAIVGTPGSGRSVRVEQTAAGALRFVDPISFGIDIPSPCGASVRYDDLSFTVDGSGHLSGSGRGAIVMYAPKVVGTMPTATMVLTGLPDTDPPTFSLSAAGDIADPWTPLWFVSSEPLPADQMRPVLRSDSGDATVFGAPTGPDTFVTVLAKPLEMLRFGTLYRVTVDGITDLAGNLPSPGELSFTTRPAPPLIAPDGFESVTDETLGGARVLSGAGAPVISGARSLYVPPGASLGPAGKATLFALRVPVTPGANMLRYSYRLVNPGDPGTFSLVIGSVGGTIGGATPPAEAATGFTPATIDGAAVSVGQVITTLYPLDAGVTEVVFALTATQAGSCGVPPPPPIPGLIVDDVSTQKVVAQNAR